MLGIFDDKKEAGKLVDILGVKAGSVIGEVGSGGGEMLIQILNIIGSTGKYFSTEIDEEDIWNLREMVKRKRLSNFHVIEGSDHSANLPPNSCDAIFIRLAYHHFINPEKMNQSLYKAMKPNGKLAVIDFTPSFWMKWWAPKGIPENRGGHGMPKDILIKEMEDAGFELVKKIDPWFYRFYCFVFRKPNLLAK